MTATYEVLDCFIRVQGECEPRVRLSANGTAHLALGPTTYTFDSPEHLLRVALAAVNGAEDAQREQRRQLADELDLGLPRRDVAEWAAGNAPAA